MPKDFAKYPHRMGKLKLFVTDSAGNPIRKKDIKISQISHKFMFGCAAFDSVPMANCEYQEAELDAAEQRFEKFFDIFNTATLPFYWGRFEPERGKPDTYRLMKAAQWLKTGGMILKGHPLCWHTVTAPWLMELSNQEILEAQISRIERDVADFAGVCDMWDVINEVVIMPIFDKYDNGITRISKDLGRIGIVRTMFDAAKRSNPEAVLLINDFDTSISYEILIEGCMEAGIPIDAIGIQSHMHRGYWGEDKTYEVLERFSRFNLPLHFTENTIISGHLMPKEIQDLNDYQIKSWPTTPEGEDRQARETAAHYEILFSHPLVESVTWWNFTDDAWLGAPAGFLRLDGTAKPAYHALHELIKGKWWSDTQTIETNDLGELEFSGILGTYEIDLCGKKQNIVLKSGQESAKVSF